MRRAICAVLAGVLLLAALAAGCGSGAGKGTLRVGVRDDIMNFGYLNEDTGKYYGLEIDLAAEMAERMGYSDVEYVTVTPDTRKDMLLAGDVDCIVATYSIADSRLESFDFSDSYYTDSTVIVVEKSTQINSIYDLKGLNIGTMAGANATPLLGTKLFELGIIGEEVISNSDTFTQYDGVSVTKAPSYQELDVLLEQGDVDAACMDKCIAQTYMDDDRMFLETKIADQDYGVATQKGSELSGEVKAAVREILDGPFYKGVVSLGDNSVNIRVMVLCAEADRIQMERDLNREMKLLFDKYNINIPYPQIVVNKPATFQEATVLEKYKSQQFAREQREASGGYVEEDEEEN